MAKFLSIYVTNTGLTAGERLINADQITTVTQVEAQATVITLAQAGTNFHQITLSHTSTGTTPSVRDAINDAITAVPGGQTVAVSLPVGIVCDGIAFTVPA